MPQYHMVWKSVEFAVYEANVNAALREFFAIGNDMAADIRGNRLPNYLRSFSVGDVVVVYEDEVGYIDAFRCQDFGWSRVDDPRSEAEREFYESKPRFRARQTGPTPIDLGDGTGLVPFQEWEQDLLGDHLNPKELVRVPTSPTKIGQEAARSALIQAFMQTEFTPWGELMASLLWQAAENLQSQIFTPVEHRYWQVDEQYATPK